MKFPSKIWLYLVYVKSKVKILSVFVTLLENLNFNVNNQKIMV